MISHLSLPLDLHEQHISNMWRSRAGALPSPSSPVSLHCPNAQPKPQLSKPKGRYSKDALRAPARCCQLTFFGPLADKITKKRRHRTKREKNPPQDLPQPLPLRPAKRNGSPPSISSPPQGQRSAVKGPAPRRNSPPQPPGGLVGPQNRVGSRFGFLEKVAIAICRDWGNSAARN